MSEGLSDRTRARNEAWEVLRPLLLPKGRVVYGLCWMGRRYFGPKGGVVYLFPMPVTLDDIKETGNGTYCGFLSWARTTVEHVNVLGGYQREGVATALWDIASDRCPGLAHSDDLTEDARKWIAALDRRDRTAISR